MHLSKISKLIGSAAALACTAPVLTGGVEHAFRLPVFSFATAQAESSSPAVKIKSVFQEVQQAITANKGDTAALDEKLKQIIFPVFDFDEMSRRSLGPSWKKANPAEQKEFVSLFSDLLSRTYLNRIKANASTSTIERIEETIEGDKAQVRSRVKKGEDFISIDYRLKKEPTGFRIYDVVIENVGLVSNYRSEFGQIVEREGIAGLLQRLRAKQIKTVGPAGAPS